jgi:hypothetical protein
MSLPQIEEVRRRIETCKDNQIKMYLKGCYLFAARGIELAGKLTASDFVTNPEHQVYGPKGRDAWLDFTDPPDPTWLQVIEILLKLQTGETTVKEVMAEAKKKIPVAVFRIHIAKKRLGAGEEAPDRLIALPLVKEFEPWAKEMYDYFKEAGENNYVFANLSRQDVWHYITHKQRVFEGLMYPIEKYTYLRNGAILIEPVMVNKDNKIFAHMRKLKGHGLRHVRTDELICRWNFQGIDMGAYVGWCLGKDTPAMAARYAKITHMWHRYVKLLCKPNPFVNNGDVS